MIPKKTKKADLEYKRIIFFQIGLLISLAVALLAFEWNSGESQKSLIIGPGGEDPDEATLLNTFRKKEVAPEIKPPDYFAFDIKAGCI